MTWILYKVKNQQPPINVFTNKTCNFRTSPPSNTILVGLCCVDVSWVLFMWNYCIYVLNTLVSFSLLQHFYTPTYNSFSLWPHISSSQITFCPILSPLGSRRTGFGIPHWMKVSLPDLGLLLSTFSSCLASIAWRDPCLTDSGGLWRGDDVTGYLQLLSCMGQAWVTWGRMPIAARVGRKTGICKWICCKITRKLHNTEDARFLWKSEIVYLM